MGIITEENNDLTTINIQLSALIIEVIKLQKIIAAAGLAGIPSQGRWDAVAFLEREFNK